MILTYKVSLVYGYINKKSLHWFSIYKCLSDLKHLSTLMATVNCSVLRTRFIPTEAQAAFLLSLPWKLINWQEKLMILWTLAVMQSTASMKKLNPQVIKQAHVHQWWLGFCLFGACLVLCCRCRSKHWALPIGIAW